MYTSEQDKYFLSIREVMNIYQKKNNEELNIIDLLHLSFENKIYLYCYLSFENSKLTFTKKEINPIPIEMLDIKLKHCKKDILFLYENSPEFEERYSYENIIDSKTPDIEDFYLQVPYLEAKINNEIIRSKQHLPNKIIELSEIKQLKSYFLINNNYKNIKYIDDKDYLLLSCGDNNFNIIIENFPKKIIHQDKQALRINNNKIDYFGSVLSISIVKNKRDLFVNFLDDIYIQKEHLEDVFRVYEFRKDILDFDIEKDINSTIEHDKTVHTPSNDAKDRLIKTYKTLILGLILVMDKKENKRRYKYWGRRGINFNGLSNAIVDELQYFNVQFLEDLDTRNPSTYSRKMQEVIALLEEEFKTN